MMNQLASKWWNEEPSFRFLVLSVAASLFVSAINALVDFGAALHAAVCVH